VTCHDDAWRVAGMPDGDYGDDLNEADAAWAEMYGHDGGGGGAFDMGNMGAALPAAPTTRLSPELTQFLSGLTCSLARAQHALQQRDIHTAAVARGMRVVVDLCWALLTCAGWILGVRVVACLHEYGTGLQLNASQCRTLAGVLERSGVQSVKELREIRWSLTTTLGIDYGLACAIAQGLDQF